jgi:hypothetical protein
MNGTLLVNYPPLTLEEVKSKRVPSSGKVKIAPPSYPEITLQKEEKRLYTPYPAWYLSKEGNILEANLLSFWLWDTVQPNKFLGINVSDVFSRNFKRLPKKANGEFYTKKTSVFKRLEADFGSKPYLSYIEGLRADPELWNIYEKEEWLYPEQWLHEDEWESKREWQYALRIVPPGRADFTHLLEFKVTVYRIVEHTDQDQAIGFFAIDQPMNETTRKLVQQKYDQAMAIVEVKKINYSQSQGLEQASREELIDTLKVFVYNDAAMNSEQSAPKRPDYFPITGSPRRTVPPEEVEQANRDWQEALKNGREHLQEALEQVGPLLTSDEVAKRLGMSQDEVAKLREENKLLGLRFFDMQEHLYPVWQFSDKPNQKMVSHFEEVMGILANTDPWEKAHFFLTETPYLKGENPLDVLHKDKSEELGNVRTLAENIGEMGL